MTNWIQMFWSVVLFFFELNLFLALVVGEFNGASLLPQSGKCNRHCKLLRRQRRTTLSRVVMLIAVYQVVGRDIHRR